MNTNLRITVIFQFNSGEFGIVYKGLLKRSFSESFSQTVAVKTLKGNYIVKELINSNFNRINQFYHSNTAVYSIMFTYCNFPVTACSQSARSVVATE